MGSPQIEAPLAEGEESLLQPITKSRSKSPLRDGSLRNGSKSPPQHPPLVKTRTPTKSSTTSLRSNNSHSRSPFNDTDKRSQSPQPRPKSQPRTIQKEASPKEEQEQAFIGPKPIPIQKDIFAAFGFQPETTIQKEASPQPVPIQRNIFEAFGLQAKPIQ